MLPLLTAVALATAAGTSNNTDLVWFDDPSAWHQQLARIVDHRFSTFKELKEFAQKAKVAGLCPFSPAQFRSFSLSLFGSCTHTDRATALGGKSLRSTIVPSVVGGVLVRET